MRRSKPCRYDPDFYDGMVMVGGIAAVCGFWLCYGAILWELVE